MVKICESLAPTTPITFFITKLAIILANPVSQESFKTKICDSFVFQKPQQNFMGKICESLAPTTPHNIFQNQTGNNFSQSSFTAKLQKKIGDSFVLRIHHGN